MSVAPRAHDCCYQGRLGRFTPVMPQVAAPRCSGYHGSATGARQRELKVVNGKVVVEIETMELLLKLLNNDRLRSPINDELFDSRREAPQPGHRS